MKIKYLGNLKRLNIAATLLGFIFISGCSKAPSLYVAPKNKMPSSGDPSLHDTKVLFQQILQDNFDCSSSGMSGKAELRLLTADEYQNTVTDVLSVTTDYRSSLFKPAEVNGFNNNADVGTVSDSRLDLYMIAAQKIADEIKPKLPNLVSCTENERIVCAEKVINNLAPALWRRPLSNTEKTELLDFYSKSDSPSDSMTLLLMRLLTSTNFLYRSEIGSENGLTEYELASALSYFFWGTVPDKALRELADNKSLSKSSILEREANRLLADKRSSYFLNSFSGSWLGYKRLPEVEKDQAKFPEYNSKTAALMVNEANDTFEYLVRKTESKFQSLLTNDFSIAPSELASFYKAESVTIGSDRAVSFSKEPRRGVYSLGAVLTALAPYGQTNPFRTGGFLMSRLLCDEPTPTPDGLIVALPQPKPDATGRELAEAHSENPACKGCHVKIDGLGFAFETFNAVGVYRSSENGKNIDPSGKLIGVDGKDEVFEGVDGLSALLADSRQAKRCFTLQLYRYAHGHLERSEDVCSVREISNSLESQNLSLTQLIIKVITHTSFTKRGK
ncbi:MAG: DUF1592 domain-containing protein [Proteobacteria bacterium]|nr:MAG: DUF1592 domain-containing protein [Pseudomonadota bacterium]